MRTGPAVSAVTCRFASAEGKVTVRAKYFIAGLAQAAPDLKVGIAYSRTMRIFVREDYADVRMRR